MAAAASVMMLKVKTPMNVYRFECEVPSSFYGFCSTISRGTGVATITSSHRVTYKDTDGDHVTISSDATLAEALRPLGADGAGQLMRLLLIPTAPSLCDAVPAASTESAASGSGACERKRKRRGGSWGDELGEEGGHGEEGRRGGRGGRGRGRGFRRRERRREFLMSLSEAMRLQPNEVMDHLARARGGDADAGAQLRSAMRNLGTGRVMMLKLLLGIPRPAARALLESARSGNADAVARVRAVLGNVQPLHLCPHLPAPAVGRLARAMGLSIEEAATVVNASFDGDGDAQQRLLRATFAMAPALRVAIASRCALREARQLVQDAQAGEPFARATIDAVCEAAYGSSSSGGGGGGGGGSNSSGDGSSTGGGGGDSGRPAAAAAVAAPEAAAPMDVSTGGGVAAPR